METAKTVIGWGIAGVAGVGVTLLAVMLLASGCERRPSGFDRHEPAGSGEARQEPAPAPAPKPAVNAGPGWFDRAVKAVPTPAVEPTPKTQAKVEALPVPIPLRTIYLAYTRDPAKAAVEYGGRVIGVVIHADDVRATAGGGFVVLMNDYGRTRHEFRFPATAAARLSGAKGKQLTVYGRVVKADEFGVVLNCD